MEQSGITTEGQPVIAGVFPLVGTHGVPLEFVLSEFKRCGQDVDWPDYVRGAIKDGHKPRTIKARILSAVGDVFGPKHAAEVKKRLDVVLEA